MDGRVKAAVQIALEIAADDSHGYDQANRLGPDFDCSSFIAYVLRKAGFGISPESTWTGNMLQTLLSIGFEKVNDPEVLPGDIFLTPYKHVVMSVGNWQIVHASINENGGITGGKPGDQTGKEICVRDFYVPDCKWTYHIRYKDTYSDIGLDEAITVLARETIRGRFGNGHETRMKKIYEMVRARVNQIMKGE